MPNQPDCPNMSGGNLGFMASCSEHGSDVQVVYFDGVSISSVISLTVIFGTRWGLLMAVKLFHIDRYSVHFKIRLLKRRPNFKV
jgi:hypothetical protein